MDIPPLNLAALQLPRLWIAVGGDIGEPFDTMLNAPRDRPEPADPEAARPGETDEPTFGEDDRVEGSSDPEPVDSDDAPTAAAGEAGYRQSPDSGARGDPSGNAAQTSGRDGATSDTSRTEIVEPATGSLTKTQPRPAVNTMALQSGRGTAPELQIGIARSSIQPTDLRGATVRDVLVQVVPDRSPAIAPPGRALGGPTALAVQTIVTDLTEARPDSRAADTSREATIRNRPTALAKKSGSAKNATTASNAEAIQGARAAASPAAGFALAGLPGHAAGAGAVPAGTIGGGQFGAQGLPSPALGHTTSLNIGHSVQATRPAAAPQVTVEQVALQIRKAAGAGQDRVNIRLYPAELGRVDVRLEWAEDGVLRAAISAERSETLDLLQRDSRALDRALQEAGLKTDSGSLSFDLRAQAESDAMPQQTGDEHFGGSGAQSKEQDAAEGGGDPAVHHRRPHDGILDLSV